MLSDEEQSAFLGSIQRVRQHVVIRLQPLQEAAPAIAFIENLHRSIDNLMQQRDAAAPTLACTPACAYCCHVRVEASEPEIFHITGALKQRSDTELAILRERLKQYIDAAAGQGTNAKRQPCAFLVSNLCSIYAQRPAVCRKAHSLSLGHCASQASEIPQDLSLLLNAEALIQGTTAAYRDAGLPAASHDLATAVLLALTDTDAEANWFAGKTRQEGV